jgi:predicted secreted protein
MSTGTAGIGTQFRRWNSSLSTPAFEKMANIVSIDGPGRSRETIDITTLDSTGGYREFIGSLRDAGTVTLTMNFVRDTYELMNTDFESDTVGNYEIVLPDSDNTSLEFEALVTELNLTTALDDKITADVTLKVSGKPTLNSGSATSI